VLPIFGVMTRVIMGKLDTKPCAHEPGSAATLGQGQRLIKSKVSYAMKPVISTPDQFLFGKRRFEMKKLFTTVSQSTVLHTQGTVNLSGWVHGPREVHQARYLVSKLPGVERAYSSGVRTWVATDQTQVF
jgi:hypothetical protein